MNKSADLARAALRAAFTPLALAVLVAGIVFVGTELTVGPLGSDSMERTVLTMLVNLILVVGLYSFTGVSGVFSFGHMSFMAVGAYTGAILVMEPETKAQFLPEAPRALVDAHLSTIPSVIVGGAFAAVLASLIAVPLMRTSGLTAGLATFAVLNVVYIVAKSWEQVTNSVRGISPVPVVTTRESALVWALLAIGTVYAFQQSRIGLRLQAAREDEVAAKAMGVDVRRVRWIAFMVSGFIVGVGGALNGQLLGAFTPENFYLGITFFTIAMLVVGGLTSLTGAVFGTIVITALLEFLRRLELGVDVGPTTINAPAGLREVGVGLAIVLILALRPRGITGGRELPWPTRAALVAGRTEEAFYRLREAIENGELKPGERLAVGALQQELGMRMTPVREALRVLEAEKLVAHSWHGDFTVVNYSVESIEENYAVRAMLEPRATELAVERMSEAELGDIRRAHAAFLAAVETGAQRTQLAALNAAWHEAVYRASGSPDLIESIGRLRAVVPLQAVWVSQRALKSAEEHKSIMEALEVRDASRAAALMGEHVESGAAMHVERQRRFEEGNLYVPSFAAPSSGAGVDSPTPGRASRDI